MAGAAAASVPRTPLPPPRNPLCSLSSRYRKVSTLPLPLRTSPLSLRKSYLPHHRKDSPPCPAAATSTSADGAPADAPALQDSSLASGTDVVMEFYDGINRGDLAAVAPLIAEDCVYEDLVFSSPFVGRQAILDFFKQFMGSTGLDLKFVIDDISKEDSERVGVIWHVEWQGRSFPFSRGCSFYKLEVRDGKRQITYGRDNVEPTIKPGELTIVAIRVVTSLLQHFPQLAKWL